MQLVNELLMLPIIWTQTRLHQRADWLPLFSWVNLIAQSGNLEHCVCVYLYVSGTLDCLLRMRYHDSNVNCWQSDGTIEDLWQYVLDAASRRVDEESLEMSSQDKQASGYNTPICKQLFELLSQMHRALNCMIVWESHMQTLPAFSSDVSGPHASS